MKKTVEQLGADRVLVAPSCSLLHVPHGLRSETKLPFRIRGWFRFAEEKLAELVALGEADVPAAKANAAAAEDREAAETTTNPAVRAQLSALHDIDFTRASAYSQRTAIQRREFGLPLFPTTTIGSFPQTAEVRKHRAAHKRGHETTEQYESFLREAIANCVREQERVGLDVLVHGEFERNDMVEYFAEFLGGFVFTENGWVQSYGSRCVKPPIIYGDVVRLQPMTLKWTNYARSLTSRPMKGMLTGPITVLQWSFVRDDIPRQQTAWQIALALRAEVKDLEEAGIRIIQVDEPALREGLPLRHAEWAAYLDWAVMAFKLATSTVDDRTQIHTHMCYCQFDDILPSIAALDADVISMETARSRMELLDVFRVHGYHHGIGPGVYDIHSPRVPSAEEMSALLTLAAQVLKPEQIWVNPDCGLKTRAWPETVAALENMCQAAGRLRSLYGSKDTNGRASCGPASVAADDQRGIVQKDLLAHFVRLAEAAPSTEDLLEGMVRAIFQQLANHNWVGFYMLDPEDAGTLVLGPFAGDATPHVRIAVGQGICGAAASAGKSIIIDDVTKDPRYLSCSLETKSEIVVPIFANGELIGEIDVDSHSPAAFSQADRMFLEEAAHIVGAYAEDRSERRLLV